MIGTAWMLHGPILYQISCFQSQRRGSVRRHYRRVHGLSAEEMEEIVQDVPSNRDLLPEAEASSQPRVCTYYITPPPPPHGLSAEEMEEIVQDVPSNRDLLPEAEASSQPRVYTYYITPLPPHPPPHHTDWVPKRWKRLCRTCRQTGIYCRRPRHPHNHGYIGSFVPYLWNKLKCMFLYPRAFGK